jgi:hypothetical protein
MVTMKQVRRWYETENPEIALATQAQIDKLCEELGHDMPQMQYDMAREELDSLIAEAKAEFGF